MSSELQPAQFELGFSPSRYCLAYLLVVAALVLAAIASLQVSPYLQLLLIVVSGMWWWRVFAKHYLRKGDAVVQSLSFERGLWWLGFQGQGTGVENATRRKLEASLEQATLWPVLMFLVFKVGNRRYHLLCWPDSAPPRLQRELRVIVNLRGLAPVNPEADSALKPGTEKDL